MERYIDILKQRSVAPAPERMTDLENKELIDSTNPCVVCCITLGKELHAGHLFLITTAEQMRSALDSPNPVILVNNNTGPRAAGALITVAQRLSISLEEAASRLNAGEIPTSEIVAAYRARNNTNTSIEEASKVLATGQYDIFSRVANETRDLLTSSGFNIDVCSEAALLSLGIDKTQELNPVWKGTGFMPFSDNKRTVILEKSGNLTATGSLFTSINALSEQLQSDFVVTVDSNPDARDASFTYSKVQPKSNGVHLPGAGVGFGGEIASGTAGEALTIREISEAFSLERPNGNLRQSALILMYTKPLSMNGEDESNLAYSFYDFQDNSALLNLLLSCSDDLEVFRESTLTTLNELGERIGTTSVATSKGATDLLVFLPQKLHNLIQMEKNKVVANSKKITLVKAENEIQKYVKELGYSEVDNPYRDKKRKLAIRNNYYFDYLNKLTRLLPEIESLTPEQFKDVSAMLQFCVQKTGL